MKLKLSPRIFRMMNIPVSKKISKFKFCLRYYVRIKFIHHDTVMIKLYSKVLQSDLNTKLVLFYQENDLFDDFTLIKYFGCSKRLNHFPPMTSKDEDETERKTTAGNGKKKG